MVAAALAGVTLLYYQFRGFGFGHGEHAAEAGFATVLRVLDHSVVVDYIPFIVLLFSLFTISGGISLRGDIPARPLTRTRSARSAGSPANNSATPSQTALSRCRPDHQSPTP